MCLGELHFCFSLNTTLISYILYKLYSVNTRLSNLDCIVLGLLFLLFFSLDRVIIPNLKRSHILDPGKRDSVLFQVLNISKLTILVISYLRSVSVCYENHSHYHKCQKEHSCKNPQHENDGRSEKKLYGVT